MKDIFLCLNMMTISFTVICQPSIQWQKSLGGSGHDAGISMVKATDGGYIIAGDSNSQDGDISGNHGSMDIWIVKLNSNGNIQWQKSYGGSGIDLVRSIQLTNDGGYVFAGGSNSTDGDVTFNNGSFDIWIVKIDSIGNIQWQKSYGGSGGEIANSINQTTDGGYIVAGSSNSMDGDVSDNKGGIDYWILKLDNNGLIQWQKSLGGSYNDIANSIQETSDSGYVVLGSSQSYNGDVSSNYGWTDCWIVKLDNIGMIQWEKSFGGTAYDWGISVRPIINNGFIVAGTTTSNDIDVIGNNGGRDFWLVKLNDTGSIQWQKPFGGSNNEDLYFLEVTSDGGYILAGSSLSNDLYLTANNGMEDFWILKTDSIGTIQWQKSLGGSGIERALSVIINNDGSFIAAGLSNSIDGDVSGNNGNYDYWVAKLSSITSFNQLKNGGFEIHPNPTNDKIIISSHGKIGLINIFDITGKKVKQVYILNENGEVNIKELDSGVYFFEIEKYLYKIVKY